MARQTMKSPRQRYGERIKAEIFRKGVTTAYIAEISGVNANTLRSWKSNPGAMPAYQYLRLLDALKNDQ